MGAVVDVAKSLFTLVKYNQGKFKSEKQADFLLKFFDNGVYVTSQSLQFGEFDQRTARNTANVSFIFEATKEGIQKLTKQTSKKTEVVFENTPEFLAALKAKEENRQLAVYKDKAYEVASTKMYYMSELKQAQETLDKRITERDQLLADLNNKFSDPVSGAPTNFDERLRKSVVDYCKKEVDEAQDRVNSVLEKLSVDDVVTPEMWEYINRVSDAFFQFGTDEKGVFNQQALSGFIQAVAGFAPVELGTVEQAVSLLETAFNKKSFEAAAYGFVPEANEEATSTVQIIVRSRWVTTLHAETQLLLKPYQAQENNVNKELASEQPAREAALTNEQQEPVHSRPRMS